MSYFIVITKIDRLDKIFSNYGSLATRYIGLAKSCLSTPKRFFLHLFINLTMNNVNDALIFFTTVYLHSFPTIQFREYYFVIIDLMLSLLLIIHVRLWQTFRVNPLI